MPAERLLPTRLIDFQNLPPHIDGAQCARPTCSRRATGTSAIAGYDASHAPEVALYRTWLAEAYARSGELDAARATIGKAEQAARALKSTRLDLRVTEVAQLAG